MPFDINKVPFYKAVSHFEAGEYKLAFELFLKVACKGNIHAPYYLKYIKDKYPDQVLSKESAEEKESSEAKESVELKGRSEAENNYLKLLDEHLENLPQRNRPDYWQRASVLIIEIEQHKKSSSTKALQKGITQLFSYIEYAQNAVIYLSRLYFQDKKNKIFKSINIKTVFEKLVKSADIYSLYYINTPGALGGTLPCSLPPYVAEEWKFLSKNAELSYTERGGENERALSLNTKNAVRKHQWQCAAAAMGESRTQTLFTTPNPILSKSEQETNRWLRLAAYTSNSPDLHFNYSAACLKIKLVTEGRKFLELALTQVEKLLDLECITPAEVGKSYYILGKMAEQGDGGLIADDALALTYYKQAEHYNSPRALMDMGTFYMTARGGLPVDFSRALQYYEKALKEFQEQGLTETYEIILELQRKIGVAAINIADTEENPETRSIYYKKAYEHLNNCKENAAAAASMGVLLLKGRGVPQNIEAAKNLFVESAVKGNVLAGAYLALFYVRGEIDLQSFGLTEHFLIECLIQIKNDPAAATHEMGWLSLLGHMYETLSSGPDLKRAYECYFTGALKKEIFSLRRMAEFYAEGCPELDIAPDPERAYEYYAHGAERGNSTALFEKGRCLHDGTGVKQDYELAKESYELSLGQEDSMGAYGLGRMYYNGEGVPKSFERAFQYFEQAFKLQQKRPPSVHCSDLDHVLAMCYHLGRGTKVQLDRACFHYEKAIQLKNSAAVQNYVVLKMTDIMNTGKVEISVLEDLLEKLNICIEKGYAASFFLKAMIQLLLDPTQKKKVQEELTKAIETKPFKRSKQTINYLKQIKTVTPTDILVLLVAKDPEEELKKSREITSSRDQDLEKKKKEEVNNAENSNVQDQDEKIRRELRRAHFEEELEAFTDPTNRKTIDIHKFESLLGRMSLAEELNLEIHPSKKGSNRNYKVTQNLGDTGNTMLFKYHPTHTSGSAPDAHIDRKRRKNLQTFVQQVTGQ